MTCEGDRFATPVARKECTPAIQSIVVVGVGAKDHSRVVSVYVAACVSGGAQVNRAQRVKCVSMLTGKDA